MRSFAQRFGPSPPKSARLTGSGTSTFPKAKRIAQSDQAAPRTSFDFAKVRLYAPAETPVQARLEVGPAADAHEKEADRIASEIVSTPGLTYPNRAAHPTIQTSRGQLARAAASTDQVAPAVDVGAALQAPGQAIDPHTRAFMESRFGHDFSDVRVHTGTAAAASASGLNARAYTVGRDVVFASGEYAPTAKGGPLLAHELAHVVQQSAGEPVVQCAPAPGADHPAKSAGGKADSRISTLRAKAAEVQSKLRGLSRAEEWRGGFRASNDEKQRQIDQLFAQWEETEKEWRRELDEFYLMERADNPQIEERLNKLYNELSGMYWQNKNASAAEQKYEAESRKQEAALLAEQAAIIAEIGNLGKPGALSQSQYDSLLARLNKLSAAVGDLWNAEIQAQMKYTGSGPVSKAAAAAPR